jgi:uncharacterized protein with NRDE domain
MCTVTFVPLPEGILLTSNRDEKKSRPTISPKIYNSINAKLLFPKDEKAGGTWIVAKNDGTIIVLLNGAFEKHQLKSTYSKSRGVVLLEVIESSNSLAFFKTTNLLGVEPFTLIVFQNQKLYELKWDEENKYIFEHDVTTTHIWSSSTLYSKEKREERKYWFEQFVAKNEVLTKDKILDFHQNTHSQNTEYGLVIDRGNELKTLSITQVLSIHNQITMDYIDIEKDLKETVSF